MSSEASTSISDERIVPRGLVHRRMMEFDQQSHHNRSHSDSPYLSPTVHQPIEVQTRPQSSGRTHIVVGCRPTITNYLSDEDYHIERRTVYRRSIDGKPHITVQQTAQRSRSKSPRSYPVVTVKVGEPDEQSRSIAQSAFPPNELYSTVIPIERGNELSPAGPATKKAIQVERSDEISRNFRTTPTSVNKREHSLYEGRHYSTPTTPSTSGYGRIMSAEELRPDSYRNQFHAGPVRDGSILEEEDLEMETDEEVQLRVNELKQAKQTIRNLAVELARLERDKKMLEIESSLNVEKTDAKVASSMADLIQHMRKHSDQYEPEEIYENYEKDPVDVVDFIASDCQRMLSSLKENERLDSTDEDNNYQRPFRSFPMGLNSIMDADDRRPSTSSDSSQILSLKDQSVAYSSSGNIQNTLIGRLERELTDAQTTNHRLNAQLANLVSSGNSTLKKEMQELKRDLKSSRDEVDQLKKKIQKAERDRQQWDMQKKTLESKLPIDVQLLMAQKRELTMQLDREQNEKHELFLQINSMIAQLADSGDVDRIKEENRTLKKRLDDSEMISSSESSRFKEEARKLQEEMDIGRRTFELEKRKLNSDTEELRKELNMKAAALQSLMLAKQDSGKLDKLAEENRQINEQLETVKEELEERAQKIEELQKKLVSTSSAESEIERFKKDLEEAREESENERTQKQNLSKSIDDLNRKLSTFESSAEDLKKELNEKEKKIQEVEKRNRELQESHHTEFSSLRQEATQKSSESTELQQKIKILETTLQEKDTKIDATKVSLLAAESKAVQAESDLKNLDQQLKNSERRALQLESQLSAAGDGEKEVELLREQLRKAEERYEILMNRQQKAEANNQELAQNLRAEVSRLESQLAEAERDNSKVEETKRKSAKIEEDYSKKMESLQESLKSAESVKHNSDQRIQELEKQLKDTESERKKLESKASVADELTTLMSSLQAVRIENGQYQDEISALHSELSEYREEREQNNEEIGELQRKTEELQKEKEALEKTVDKDRIRISAISKEKENLESAESERLKLETMMEAMERTSSELVKGITDKEKQLDELKSKSEGKSREMREEVDALKAKLESAQKRNTELEEERIRVVGSGDEEKQRLLGEITVLREKSESFHLESESLKSKLVSANELCTSHEEKEKTLEEMMEAMERTSSELVKGITDKEKQLDELKSKSEEKSREMREELDGLKAKLESAQKRNTELEEERKRVVGSGDEEKQRLLGEIAALREKADASHLESESLKSKLVSANQLCTSHEEKEKTLEDRIKILEKEYEEAKSAAAANSAETACKARDAERMGEKIKLQLEELEQAQKVKDEEIRKEKEQLEQEIKELRIKDTENVELMRRMEKTIEDTQREKQTVQLEKKAQSEREIDEIRKELSEAVKRAELAEKTRDELISQMKTMTTLMEEEAKRIEELIEEKKRLQEKSEEIEKKLLADKTPELTAENSRLKAEIHKMQEQNEREMEAVKGRNQNNQEAEEQMKILTLEQTKLTTELQEARTKVQQLNRSVVAAEKKKKEELAAVFIELGMVKDERARLQDRIDHMYANGSTGTVRTVSNMSFTSNYTMADFSEIDDVDILRGQIDKQKRLIIVLRRKLQGLQPKLT